MTTPSNDLPQIAADAQTNSTAIAATGVRNNEELSQYVIIFKLREDSFLFYRPPPHQSRVISKSHISTFLQKTKTHF